MGNGNVVEDPFEVARKEFTPATFSNKLLMAFWLIIAAIIVSVLWFHYLGYVDRKLNAEFNVSWSNPENLILRPGPPSFKYDRDKNELIYSGVIDSKRKQELVSLIECKGKEITAQQGKTYWEAIDKLSYDSNQALKDYTFYLILLGGISGVMGVILRSFVDYVGNACFKNSLDVKRWWPWYLLRPGIGFLVGIVAVSLTEAGFVTYGDKAPGGMLWWISVAILSGYGADEFTQLLRRLTLTLFGEKK